ncbi:ATP-dependent 6-phosphofructokinase [Neosynechococcus sphagnicola]|uniref:ATP-dependent 6-phosphofructokinase n=1 Tax=Neosynechococcus sphagnicola TaxID=1501145 RepID=UPI000691F634|nr:ATP-dependent 6-phosphofructokinase [Neosynechococcus sphagnicola]
MTKPQKKLGILTSGGDCPGLNSVIRAVINHAVLTYGWQVLGIPYATQGLLDQKAIPLSIHGLDLRGIDPLINMGGTILGTINRGDTLAHFDQIQAGYQALGLDALIGIGGDGSLAILNHLANQGSWQFIGVPKTIDNDIALTERVVGFDTAVNTITDALNRLTFTASSHDRVMIVEVMGREAGHLALHAGIAGGADVILMPEIPYAIQDVCRHLTELRDRWGRRFAIIVVAEGAKTATDSHDQQPDQRPSCGIGQYLASEIISCSAYPVDVRVSMLGHIQRGGIPSALDRLIATAFGKVAVDLIAQGQSKQMVAWQSGQVVAVPLEAVIAANPLLVTPDSQLVQTARALGIYVGSPAHFSPIVLDKEE